MTNWRLISTSESKQYNRHVSTYHKILMLVSSVPTGWIQHSYEGDAFSERSAIRVCPDINDQISTKIQTGRQGKCSLYLSYVPHNHN